MKKLWLDVETTGLSPRRNGVIQLACIDEDTGDTFKADIKPFSGCVYDVDAEKIHGKSEAVISEYVHEYLGIVDFIKWLNKHKKVNEQFQIAGYNSRFDMEFIISLFKRNNIKFWSYFNYYDLDTFALVKLLDIKTDGSLKLVDVCKTFGVKLKNAHDALSDIKATRKLHNKLCKKYLK